MEKRTLTLLIADLQEIGLGKDVFLVPYYIGKMYHLNVSIVFPKSPANSQLPPEYRGVKLKPLRFKSNNAFFSFRGEWGFFPFMLRHAREMDVLMRFHFSYQTFLLALLYKLLNRKSLFYLKSDGYGLFTSLFRKESSLFMRIKNMGIRKIMHATCRLADIISVETPEVYNYLRNELPARDSKKLVLMLNGFDEELRVRLQIQKRTFMEKENLILAVGRIGAPDKNNEQLLSALESVDLKDWRIVFVGPVETSACDFQQKIDRFYAHNPHLKEKVIFTGAVYNKKELWEWYNRARVFVHTSPKESYGIVLNEAFYFDNFILSTDVGIAGYLIDFGYGQGIKHNDASELATCLQEIIDGKIALEKKLQSRTAGSEQLTWENEIAKLGELDSRNRKE